MTAGHLTAVPYGREDDRHRGDSGSASEASCDVTDPPPPPQVSSDGRFDWFVLGFVAFVIILAFVGVLLIWLGSPG